MDTKTGNKLRSATIEDVAHQAALQPWIPMECFQLDRGAQVARMQVLDSGTWQIVRETQEVAVQKLGITPPDLCTISCCTRDPSARFSEMHMGDADLVFFMPEKTEFDIYVPGGAQTNYISLSQAEVLSSVRILNPEDWESAPRNLLTLQSNQKNDLQDGISFWLEAAGAGVGAGADASRKTDVMRGMLTEQIIRIVAAPRQRDAMPSSLGRSRAYQICRSARAFVEDCLAADVLPTVLAICRHVGVSERSLQYAFLAYVDCSPQAYLRLCRLNRVRAALRAADPQTTRVTDLATRFGFFHLGRFSQDYRRVFGEMPSVTLSGL